jgi:hypothetical protein
VNLQVYWDATTCWEIQANLAALLTTDRRSASSPQAGRGRTAPPARASSRGSGSAALPASRIRCGIGRRTVFPAKPCVISSTESYVWRPATRMQREPNVFPCFSPVTGKRSHSFRRNSSLLRSLGKAGDLGFEPRLHDPASIMGSSHQPRVTTRSWIRMIFGIRRFPGSVSGHKLRPVVS